MIELIFGVCIGFLIAIFFPEQFEKVKKFSLKIMKKCDHE